MPTGGKSSDGDDEDDGSWFHRVGVSNEKALCP